MALNYAFEKLNLAVSTLIGQGDQRTRLFNALISNVLRVTAEDFPNREVRDEFEAFMKSVSRVPARADEGTIRATVDQMDESEVDSACEKIFEFYTYVCEEYFKR